MRLPAFLSFFDKTKPMVGTTKSTKIFHSLPTLFTVVIAQSPFKHSDKNFGFILGLHPTMSDHLTNAANIVFLSVFVLLTIDYCNSLLCGSTYDVTFHLQQIQNYAALVILCIPTSSNIDTQHSFIGFLSKKEAPKR